MSAGKDGKFFGTQNSIKKISFPVPHNLIELVLSGGMLPLRLPRSANVSVRIREVKSTPPALRKQDFNRKDKV